VLRRDVLREAMLHVVLAPPLQHIDNLIDVDPVAPTNLGLVDLV
jgi:hypothetical protein